MSRTLYIGNLDYNMTDEDLVDAFVKFGEIESTRVINDRETGRSRGFGFVNFKDDSVGARAIEEMNNIEVCGRQINVKVANERAPRS